MDPEQAANPPPRWNPWPRETTSRQAPQENAVTRKRPMRKILATAVFAAISASLLSVAPAQAQTPIKIMVGGIDKQIYLPAKLAAQLGFFKEQGGKLGREVNLLIEAADHELDRGLR